MKVYARYFSENGINYRRNTLIQFGNSWDLIGSIVLINPGSALPKSDNNLNDDTLKCITKFTRIEEDNEWREFNPDSTMRWIESLFSKYYINSVNIQPLNGVIQLFNLFNLRDADLSNALKTYQESDSQHLFSTEDDIKKCADKPVYFGWGNTGKSKDDSFKVLRQKAEQIFTALKYQNKYIENDFDKNSFYHPRYIQMSSKRPKVQALLNNFHENVNTHTPSEYTSVEFISKPKITSSDIQKAIVLIENDLNIIETNNLIKITDKSDKTLRISFCGLDTDILELTITSIGKKGYIAIRGLEKTNNDYNSGLKYKEKYIEVLRELNFVERETWLGSLNIDEFIDVNNKSVEGLVQGVFTQLEQFSTELTKE